jgi:RimJ/RimL family protein N-acetyltransferase
VTRRDREPGAPEPVRPPAPAERGHGIFALLDRSDSRFLGRVGLKYWPQFQETELGWVLRRDAWGHGYATEAARVCLDWGFETLPVPYFTAMIAPGNERSIRVAQRLGFEPAREDVLLGDPVIVYRVEREAWTREGSRWNSEGSRDPP